MYERNYWHETRQKGPHGGWTETLAKGGFIAMLALSIVLSVMSGRDKTIPSQAIEASAKKRADAFVNAFIAKGKNWTESDLVTVRNGLVNIMNEDVPHYDGTISYLRSRIEATVRRTLDEMHDASANAKTVEARAAAETRMLRVRRALDSNPPDPIIKEGQGTGILMKLGGALAKWYLLFMPIAFVCFYSRIVRLRMSFVNEILYGWRRLLTSTIFWPFGLADFPNNSALSIRRTRIAIDYMARLGLGWRDLDDRHNAAIDRLTAAPKEELRKNLAALQQLPWHLLMRARFSLAMSLVIGLFWSLLSFGRGSAMAAEVQSAAVAAEVAQKPDFKPTGEMHGFAQFSADPENGNTKTERVIARLVGNPAEGLRLFFMANAANPAVYVTEAQLRKDWFGLRAGQIVLRSTYQVPAPDGQRLVGGPLSQNIIQFWRLGAEVFGEHGRASWALAYLPGPDLSKPDAKNPKEVQASIGISGLGPFGFKASAQGGKGTDGWRAFSSALASLKLGPVDVALNGAYAREGGMHSEAVSSFIGWRCSPYVDLAAGHDTFSPAQGPTEHRARAQVTLLGFKDLARVGLHGMWSSLAGFSSAMRLQFSF